MGDVAMRRDASGSRGLYTWFSHNTGLPIALLKTHVGHYPGLPRTLQDPPTPTFYRTSPPVAQHSDHTGARSEGNSASWEPLPTHAHQGSLGRYQWALGTDLKYSLHGERPRVDKSPFQEPQRAGG